MLLIEKHRRHLDHFRDQAEQLRYPGESEERQAHLDVGGSVLLIEKHRREHRHQIEKRQCRFQKGASGAQLFFRNVQRILRTSTRLHHLLCAVPVRHRSASLQAETQYRLRSTATVF